MSQFHGRQVIADNARSLAAILEPLHDNLLDALLSASHSQVALLRAVQPVVEKLELLAVKWAADSGFDIDHMSIPPQKAFSDWGDGDPTEKFGFYSAQQLKCRATSFYSEPEQAFVDWIKHKAWFPIYTGSDPWLAVLLRGGCEQLPYTIDDVVFSWSLAQSLVSLSARDSDPIHASYCSIMESLNVLMQAEFKNPSTFIQVCLHLLSSNEGLGWNRAIVFEIANDRTTMHCVAAIGETNKERWLAATNEEVKTSSSLSDQLDECVFDLSYEQDMLFKQAVGITLRSDEIVSAVVSSSIDSTEDLWVGSLEARETGVVADTIESLMLDKVVDYQPADDAQCVVIDSGKKQYLFLLSQPYHSRQQPPAMLTTGLIYYLMQSLQRARIESLDEYVSEIQEPNIDDERYNLLDALDD